MTLFLLHFRVIIELLLVNINSCNPMDYVKFLFICILHSSSINIKLHCLISICSCQTYEGGIAGEPGSEAHGGYVFYTFLYFSFAIYLLPMFAIYVVKYTKGISPNSTG